MQTATLNDYIDVIKTKFPECVDIESSDIFKESSLYKNDRNQYCYVTQSENKLLSNLFYVEIFRSDDLRIERKESDYLNWSIIFEFENIKDCKVWTEAIT